MLLRKPVSPDEIADRVAAMIRVAGDPARKLIAPPLAGPPLNALGCHFGVGR
jgi:hypothetical protein